MEIDEVPIVGPLFKGAVELGKKAMAKDPTAIAVLGVTIASVFYIMQEGS
jgi:hypothetical protein